MILKISRWLIVVAMVAAACASPGSSSNSLALPALESTAPTTAIATSLAPTSVATSVVVNPSGLAIDFARLMRTPGVTTVRGSIVGVDGSSVEMVVWDVVADQGTNRAWSSGDVVSFAVDSFLGARLGEAIRHAGGVLPVAAFVDDMGVAQLLPLEENMHRFSRDEAAEPRGVHSAANTLSRAIDDGSIAYRPLVDIDPDVYSYCQDLNPDLEVFAPGDDEVVGLLAFAARALEADQATSDRRRLRREADLKAQLATFPDEVTGGTSSGWVMDVVDQVLRGVAIEDAVANRVVRSRIDPGNLTWREIGATVVWAEAGTKRVLGWTDYNGYTAADAPQGGSTVEVMAPPSGADVEIYLIDHEMPLCIQDEDSPYITIPYDDFAGARRARILLDDATYKNWNPSG